MLLWACDTRQRKAIADIVNDRQVALQQLEDALSQAGISVTRFMESAVIAVGQMPRPWATDPAGQFSKEELATLRAGGFELSARDDVGVDPVARTAARFATLLADSADVREVAANLGVTPARIRQRANERTLYAIREADEWRFPRWQFDSQGQPMRGLAAIFAALPPDLHPVATSRFLSEPLPDLELDDEPVSPLAWLRSGGDPERAAEIARDL